MLFEEGLAIFRESGNVGGLAWSLYHLGRVFLAQGGLQESLPHKSTICIAKGGGGTQKTQHLPLDHRERRRSRRVDMREQTPCWKRASPSSGR